MGADDRKMCAARLKFKVAIKTHMTTHCGENDSILWQDKKYDLFFSCEYGKFLALAINSNFLSD